MSKLFKSKFLLGVMVVAVMAVTVLAGSPAKASADTCTITTTLRVGSKGAEVKCLQAALSLTADGSFGPKTKAAVVAWQTGKGLVADGIFGAKSRAAWTGVVSTGYPAGCTSTVGFSSTTGMPCNGGSPVVTNGPVSVSLASNNPAAGTLVGGQATADLAHFTFTGSGVVTGVTLQRLGVSADSTLSNVYLFDGATRLSDAASVGANGMVTFTSPAGLFAVNGSKTISVKSDIANVSGQTVGVMLSSFATATGTVNANLSGNIHTIASATLASVTLSGTITPSGATLNPGAAVTVWQGSLSVNTRDVWMKRLALRQVGSAPASSFANFKLFVNGVQVGTATGIDSMGYVTFDMTATPVLLASGTRVVRVDTDILSGASRTVQFSLRQAADVDFVDSSFGVNITPATTGTALPWAGTASTISGSQGGSLTIEKDTTSASGNVSEGTNDKSLGIFKVTAYGEPMKIETLRASFSTSEASLDSLRNGRLLINGVQYGSTATLMEDSSSPAYTSYTLNYTVMPGTPVLVELRADMYDNDGTDDLSNGDTITGVIAIGSSNVQKVDSLGTVSAPLAAVSANALTIADAAAVLTKAGTYANQTVVLPATNQKVGSWTLAGSSTEDILLTTLSFDVDEVSGTEFDEGDLTNMYVVVKNGSTIVAQPAPLSTVAADNNNFSINYTLTKNSTLTIELFANMSDDGADSTVDSGDSFKTDLTVTGTAMVSGQAVTATSADTDGQTIAAGTASITASKDASAPVAAIVYDGQTVTTLAAKFAALTSAYNVTDLTVTVVDATAVNSIDLYDGATLVASRPGATSVTFSGLSWNVPSNTNKVLTVKLNLGTVGIGAGTTGAEITTAITAFTAINTSSGVSAAGAGTATGSAMYVYAATPTITNVALPTTLLSAGTQTVSKFNVASNGGTIGWKYFAFVIAKNIGGTDTLASATLWDADTNTQIAGTATFTGGVAADDDVAGGLTFVADNEQQINGSKTYVLKMVVAGTIADGNNLSVSIDQPLVAYDAPDAYADVLTDDATATFVWTDTSASGHDATTNDWNHGYLVKNLPTDTQTLVK